MTDRKRINLDEIAARTARVDRDVIAKTGQLAAAPERGAQYRLQRPFGGRPRVAAGRFDPRTSARSGAWLPGAR